MVLRSTLIVSTLALLLVGSCKSSQHSPGPVADSTPAPVAPKKPLKRVQPPKPTPTLKLKLDVVLSKAIRTATGCAPTTLKSCPSYLAAMQRLNSRGAELSALATLIELVHDNDPKVVHLASSLMQIHVLPGLKRAFEQLSKDKKAFNKAGVGRLFRGLARIKGPDAVIVVHAAAYLASLYGMIDQLVEVASAHPNKSVLPEAVRCVMRYGRMDAFVHVMRLSKDSKPRVVAAALAAPFGMAKWSDDEHAKICPWVLGYLGHSDLRLAGMAAKSVVRCAQHKKFTAVHSMALIAIGKKRVSAGEWKKPFIGAYRDLCARTRSDHRLFPSKQVCRTLMRFLEWVARSNKVEPIYRGQALSMIVHQQPSAQTLKLLKRYSNHQLEPLKKAALAGIATLEKQLKIP